VHAYSDMVTNPVDRIQTVWIRLDPDFAGSSYFRIRPDPDPDPVHILCCVCRRHLSVTLCIVAKRCVLEQKLLWRAYRKSYMRNRLVPKWMTLNYINTILFGILHSHVSVIRHT